MNSYLDGIAQMNPIRRMVWLRKPKQIGKKCYIYSPTFFDEECTQLVYNYIESDFGLRARIKKLINH